MVPKGNVKKGHLLRAVSVRQQAASLELVSVPFRDEIELKRELLAGVVLEALKRIAVLDVHDTRQTCRTL